MRIEKGPNKFEHGFQNRKGGLLFFNKLSKNITKCKTENEC